jgi:xylitol oxidase
MTGDNLWLSPAYGRETVAFHFTWKPMWEEIQQVLPQIEAVLEPFEVRPHWGKVYTMPADTIKSRYERFDDFLALVKEYDPHGKFQNDFLKAYLSDA